jgi:protein gp37
MEVRDVAVVTKIAWTDATFNPWIGCTKVGPGCDHCYAEAQDQRWHCGEHWGAGAPRRRTSERLWRGPEEWDRFRAAGKLSSRRKGVDVPTPLWVFCASLADVFDNEVEPAWRADLWALIRRTPHLRWQLVTKRVGNVWKMLPADWGATPAQIGPAVCEFTDGAAYRHVGIIATVVNQEEYDRDAPKLLALKTVGVRWVGLSVEPMLGPIDLPPPLSSPGFDWVICGGESAQGGQAARPFVLQWSYWLRDQCAARGVPFFMKQVGSKPVTERAGGVTLPFPICDRAGADPAEWPEALRVRQMPRVYHAVG